MKLITQNEKISRAELQPLAERMFSGIVKAVVDIEKEVMLIDAEMHADEEAELLESGSKQEDLWGINFYPEESEEKFVEFDSMINIRPRQGNRSRGVDDEAMRMKILAVIKKLVI